MTSAPPRGRMPADLEIAGGLRAAEAKWQRKARATTIASSDLETEERGQREPDDPDRHRTYRNVRVLWQFRAWLTDAARHERS